MRDFLWNFAMLSLFMVVLILLVRFFSLTAGRKIRARTRYLLWVLILLRMCVPVLFPLPTLVEVPVGDVERYQIIERITQPDGSTDTSMIPYSEYEIRMEQGVYGEEKTVNDKLADNTLRISMIDLVKILPILWLTGVILYLIWNLGGYLLMMLRFRHTFVPAPESLNEQARTLGAVRGLKRVPKVYISDTVRSPMLCGFFRPIIVVPRMELSENETAGVLAHELTHFRHGDLWIQLFGLLVCAMHWFNPAVHLADRWMREEMELSCDEAVLDGQSEDVRSVYGNGMLTILRQCRRKTVPMTTHFSPRKRMMQARFENIMDTRQKKRGVLWIAAVLVLCILAGSAVACVQEKAAETVPLTNLSMADVRYDSKGRLHQIAFGDTGRFFSSEDLEEEYPWIGTETYIPVFANGSLLTDRNGTPAVPAKEAEDGTYLVDVTAIALTMYPDAEYSLQGSGFGEEDGTWSACFSYRIDGKSHEVSFWSPEGRVLLDKKVMDMPFSMKYYKGADGERDTWQIWVTPEDAAQLLGAEYAFYNTGSYSYIGEDGLPMLYYPFGEPFYLSNEPHLAFWRYPESASVLSEEDALAKLEEQLIRAYENAFGPFVPLEEEPASSPYPGDEIMFRWKIVHLEVASENDRFYRIPFVWDFLVDKYTGEIITHYNGIDQSFSRFKAEFPAALAFAG